MASTMCSTRTRLYDATLSATYATISSSPSSAPCRRTTHATGTSPASSVLPEDGGVLNGGVGEEDGLELGGGDLKPLVLDQLLDPVHDEHVAVAVDVPDVAGVQPPLAVHRALRLLLPLVVPLHHALAPHAQLPRRVRRQRPPGVRVHELHLQVRQDEPHRALLGDVAVAVAGGVREGDAAVLGEAVGFLHLHAGELALERGEEVGGERRGGGHDGLEGEVGEVELVGDGALDHGEHHGGNQRREHDAVVDERTEERAEVEAVHHHHRALVPERGAADAGDAVDVEERHEPQRHHLPGRLRRHGEHGRAEVGHQVAVAQHHALGHAGGAGGVGERAQVGLLRRVHRHHPGAGAVRRGEELVPADRPRHPLPVADADHRHAGVLHLVERDLVGNDQLRLGVLHLLLDLRGERARVHAGEHGPRRHDPERHDGVHGEVWERDDDDVPLPDAHRPERPGEPRRVARHLAVRVRPPARRGLHERHPVGVGLGAVQHELRHGDAVRHGHRR
ncbi:hypothetical protein EE612_023059, partial [Oryza sativa]